MKLTNCGFWPVAETQEQVVKLGPSTLDADLVPLRRLGQRQQGLAVRAGVGRHGCAVSGCDFMAEGKQPIVLEKGLKAATITGCLFRGEKPIADSSGGDVQSGLNTTH